TEAIACGALRARQRKATSATSASPITADEAHTILRLCALGRSFLSATSILVELEFRRSRLRSASISAALWYRNARSFSKALLMRYSSSAGNSGLTRTGEVGVLCSRESKISAEVFPEKAIRQVAIS